MSTKYRTGDTAAQDQQIADEIDRAVRHARMPQHFEAANAERARQARAGGPFWLALIVAGAVFFALGAMTIKTIEKLAFDIQVEVAR